MSNEVEKLTGKVKFFNKEKGFGFIKCDDDQKEYFVHATGINEEIRQDDVVEFNLTEGKKGMNAVEVNLL